MLIAGTSFGDVQALQLNQAQLNKQANENQQQVATMYSSAVDALAEPKKVPHFDLIGLTADLTKTASTAAKV